LHLANSVFFCLNVIKIKQTENQEHSLYELAEGKGGRG
jgi:hypothetical protein